MVLGVRFHLGILNASLVVLTLALPSTAAEPEMRAKSPVDSMAEIELRDGFVVELVAAEPLVQDPVAIDWGTDGKLWVAEMADYPLGVDGKGEPGGRVRCLEDTNGDGKYDKSTVFLDGLGFPNGVLAWNRGVLVTAGGEIFYAVDYDGDGKADSREPLYTGFLEGNQQLRVNGLRYGFDNWVYCASGSHTPAYGATVGIESMKTGRSVKLGSRDFRFRPNSGELEPIEGPSQFGRVRDDWGNWFGVQNALPLWHYALLDRYTGRNSYVASPDSRHPVIHGTAPRIYSAKQPQKRFRSVHLAGHFTSACGISIYRDVLLFPRGEVQHSFTCAPFHNLVHHSEFVANGATFDGRRAKEEQTSELFASRDRWCRPVMTRTGPDGALWVVDMYRYMIEHPRFLPDAGRDELRPFFRAGEDRGRIYRVYRKENPPRPIRRLDRMSVPQLVETLDDLNGVVRDLAQRLLLQRNGADVVALLEKKCEEGSPFGRLHALAVLEGKSAIGPELVLRALGDEHSAVRRLAVRLAEPLARKHPKVLAAAIQLAHDENPQVRQQLAYSLGEWRGALVAKTLGQLLIADFEDTFQRAAALSSIGRGDLETVMTEVLAAKVLEVRKAAAELVLIRMAGEMGADEVVQESLTRLLQRTKNKQATAAEFETLGEILTAVDREELGRRTRTGLKRLVRLANERMLDQAAKEEDRVAAVGIQLLQDKNALRRRDLKNLSKLLSPQTPLKVQLAAVDRLVQAGADDAAGILLDRWGPFGPAVRSEVLKQLSTRREWVVVLLDRLEQGAIQLGEIDATARQRLLVISNPDLKKRIHTLFVGTGDADRQQVLKDYQSVLKLEGDEQRGRLVFKDKCATCHRLGDVGQDVGPNLASLTDKSPAGLLGSVLDPSRTVEAKYQSYIATTNDGRIFSGILSTETGTSITLTEANGKQRVVLRRDLEDLRGTGKSLMPDGLEKEMSQQDLADVMKFIGSFEAKDHSGFGT